MKRVLMFVSVLCGFSGCPSGVTVPPPPAKEVTLDDCQDKADNDGNGWIDCWDAGCCDWGICYDQPLCAFLRTQGDSFGQEFSADTTTQFDTILLTDTSVVVQDVTENVTSSDTIHDTLSDSSETETATVAVPLDSYDTEVTVAVVSPDIFETETQDVDAAAFWLPDVVSSHPDVLEEVALLILADTGGPDTHSVDVPPASLPDVGAVVDDSEAIKVETKTEIAVADVGADAEVEAAVETLVPPLPTDINVGVDETATVETNASPDIAADEAGDDSGGDAAISVEVGDDTSANTETDIVAIIEEPEYIGDEVCNVVGSDEDDQDNDSLSNFEEYILGTDPCFTDTDNDGVADNIDAAPLGEDEGGGSTCTLAQKQPTIKLEDGQHFLSFPLSIPALMGNAWQYSTGNASPFSNNGITISPAGAQYSGKDHSAMDYLVAKGTPVSAPCDGYAVVDIQPGDDAYGLMVIIKCDQIVYDQNNQPHVLFVLMAHLGMAIPLDDPNEETRKYFHLKPADFGMKVVSGQIIGYSGKSGASWYHLHLQMYLDEWKYRYERALDPYDIYAKTTAKKCNSANFYPNNVFDTCQFEGCGSKYLWKECPPLTKCTFKSCQQQSYNTADAYTPAGAYAPLADQYKNSCNNECPAGYKVCLGSAEVCAGGFDEDSDGLVDCFDSDCLGSDSCKPEIKAVKCDSNHQGEDTTCTIEGSKFIGVENVWIECFEINSKELIGTTQIKVNGTWLCDCSPGPKKVAYRHPGAPAITTTCDNGWYSSCMADAVVISNDCYAYECGMNLCENKPCALCPNGYDCEYVNLYHGVCMDGNSCYAGGEDMCPCKPSCENKKCGNDGCGGDCGNCKLDNAAATCVDYQCLIEKCNSGWNNCNGKEIDGCETAGPCGGCPECTTLSGTSCVSLSDDIACISDNNTCTTDTCQNGQCKHVAMTCNTPPANECVGASLRVYVSVGTCSGGSCSYSYTDTNCPFGCTGKQCDGDPCTGISCINPPAPTCSQGNKVVYNTPGVCSWGICNYPSSTEISCVDSDACTIDTCEKDNCVNTPKSCSLAHASAKCVNGGCVIASCENGYNDCNSNPSDGCETIGPCGGCPECTTLSGTSCVKVQNLTTCASDGNSCTKDFCNEGNCQHVPINCYSQKPNECLDGNNLKIYNPQGKCVDGICTFNDYTTQSCQFGCSDNQCLNDPCNGVSCNSPPTPYCNNSNISKIVYNSPGVCSWGICNYNSYTETSCIDSSNCTDDYCVGGDCINPQKANTCGSKLCGWSSDGCFNCGLCSQGECDSQGQCVVKECNPGDSDWQMCDPTPGQYDYCSFEQTKTCTSQGKWGAWGSCVGDPYGSPYEYSFDTVCGNTICITVDYIYDDGTVDGYIDRKDNNKWGDYYIEWVVKDGNGTILDEPFPLDHCQPLYESAYEISFDFKAQKLNLPIAGFAKIQATVWKGGTGNMDCSTYTMKSGETTIQRCY